MKATKIYDLGRGNTMKYFQVQNVADTREEQFKAVLKTLSFEQLIRLERKMYEDDNVPILLYDMVLNRMAEIDEKRFVEYAKTV